MSPLNKDSERVGESTTTLLCASLGFPPQDAGLSMVGRHILISTIAMWSVCAMAGLAAAARNESDSELLQRLGEKQISLLDALKQIERTGIFPVSAKFEIEENRLLLSVCGARKGASVEAESNQFVELTGDATLEQWTPHIKVFEDRQNLTRSATQLTLMQASVLNLVSALKIAQRYHSGYVYSVTPIIQEREIFFDVRLVDGRKSVRLIVDADSGNVRDGITRFSD